MHMDMLQGVTGVDGKLFVPGLLGLLGLVLIGPALVRPLIFVLRLALYLAVGTILLFTANLVLEHLNLHIAVNPFTLLTAGILQVPGVLLLVALNYFFG